MPSVLTISVEDAARLVERHGGPGVRGCVCRVEGERLWLEIVVDAGIALLGRVPVTLSVRAELESPMLVAVDIRLERAMGLAGVVRPFLQSIIKGMLPPEVKEFVQVESKARLVVHLDQVAAGGTRLLEHITLERVAIPESVNAARLEFSIPAAGVDQEHASTQR